MWEIRFKCGCSWGGGRWLLTVFDCDLRHEKVSYRVWIPPMYQKHISAFGWFISSENTTPASEVVFCAQLSRVLVILAAAAAVEVVAVIILVGSGRTLLEMKASLTWTRAPGLLLFLDFRKKSDLAVTMLHLCRDVEYFQSLNHCSLLIQIKAQSNWACGIQPL